MKYVYALIVVFISGIGFSQIMIPKELQPLSPLELQLSTIIPTITTQSAGPSIVNKTMACPSLSANDNYASAITLAVNGGTVSGSTCGSLETGETTACNTATGQQSVWYKFTATAATQFVQISYLSGACYFGSAVYSSTALPTTACGDRPISCQSASYGPLVDLYQLTNLTVGQEYHIQIIYGAGGGCGTNGTFAIQVTSANPGGTITNPPYIDQCSSVTPGCYFPTPPTVNTVTAACTGYSLAANGYVANSVFTVYQLFTNSPTSSNVSFQAIITSNCGVGGNVVWLNWTLYNPSCGLIGCGDINTLTINGLACSTSYILMYQFELSNCSSFTEVWPYQNAPASPTPCTVLPIELLYFIAGMQDDNSIKLEWETANEHNSKAFILERSSDGINYTQLTSLAAAGNSSSPVKYSYTDDSRTGDGTYYYKLRQTDKDGKEAYSKIVAITIDGGGELVRFAPNPAQEYVDIVFSSKALNQDTHLEVYDTFGQKVIDEMFRPTEKLKTLDISRLPKGLYFVSMTSPAASKVVRQSLIKQ